MSLGVVAEELHKTYHLRHKAIVVLHGASLRVEAGERVAVVGRSGAGKSTLLHVLGGLVPPDRREGRVRVGETDLYALPPRRRSLHRAERIGFVFQSYHLLPEMDVVENVLLPAFAAGRPAGAARRRALDLPGRVGLQDRLAHTPLELSGGEQQRWPSPGP